MRRTTGFTASNTPRSQLSYAVEASIAAIRAAGLGAADIDGIIGSGAPSAPDLQKTLGIPKVTAFANPPIPFMNLLAAAVGAVHSGQCDVALTVHASYRLPWNTGSAVKDPFRRGGMARGGAPIPESVFGSPGYTAWASRYLYEFGGTKEDFGLVAINDRSNAARNPAAAMREPLTMEQYLSARMIRDPLCMLDMDIAVDGADAFVVTTAERAADLTDHPVLINAVTLGMTGLCDEAQSPSLRDHGQQVVVEALRAKGDFWIDDCDVYLPYDGFTIITLNWLENAGWCGPGEAGAFLREHWDPSIEPSADRRADPHQPARRLVVGRCDAGLGPHPRGRPPAAGNRRRSSGRRRQASRGDHGRLLLQRPGLPAPRPLTQP